MSPLTLPSFHTAGRAGNKWMVKGAWFTLSGEWLCSNISAMPAVQPKLPSIWNGGWASNMFG